MPKNDKQAAGDLKASYEEKLKTSDAESIRIVEESRASARAEYDRIVAEADRKAARILEDAKKAAEQEREKTMTLWHRAVKRSMRWAAEEE